MQKCVDGERGSNENFLETYGMSELICLLTVLSRTTTAAGAEEARLQRTRLFGAEVTLRH